MYNHQKFSQIISTEKMLRKDNLGPGVKDSAEITEKKVPHRTGVIETITEDQMDEAHEASKGVDIVEKILNEAESAYVDHRKAESGLFVPPINTLVEKARLDRLSSDFKTEKDSDWTVEQRGENKKQQSALPKWPKHPEQNDTATGKVVLNNDPRRFEDKKPKPLIGNITTADVHRIAGAIKTGQTLDYDAAIFAILKQADADKRELTEVEQKTIVDLKKARTLAFLQ